MHIDHATRTYHSLPLPQLNGCASRSNKDVPFTLHRRICPISSAGNPDPGSGSDTNTIGSMSGASNELRPTHASKSGLNPSMMTSSSCPTRDNAKSSDMSCCCEIN